MTLRLGAAIAAVVSFCASGAALAQDAELPETPEESRAILEQVCRDDGMTEGTCTCLGDFVAANFSERELAGAALVFSDPLGEEDPAAGLETLLSAGYSPEEIVEVANRVMALEETATTTCAVEPEPDAESDAD